MKHLFKIVLALSLLSGCASGIAALHQPPSADEISAANGSPVAISAVYGWRNYANGIDIAVTWQNISGKVLKYCYIEISLQNAVNDTVKCSVTHRDTTTLQYVGPYDPGVVHWGRYQGDAVTQFLNKGKKISIHPAAVYHPNATTIHIDKVWAVYADGSKSTVIDTTNWVSSVGEIETRRRY